MGTTGFGLIVIVNVAVDPTQATALLVYDGVTVTVDTTGILVAFTPVNEVIFPVPDAPRPIDVVLLDHVYTVEATVPLIVTPLTVEPAHTAWLLIASMVGRGLTVTVTVNVAPTQLPAAPDLGVTVYTTVCTVLLVLVSV